MRKLFLNGLALIAGVISTPVATISLEFRNLPAERRQDPRLHRLRGFFHDAAPRLEALAPAFVAASEANQLNWTLLPSLSLIESGGNGGRNNNVLGWNNGKARFPSVSQGIHSVAKRLRSSPIYRGKNVDQILAAYNRDPDYAEKVKSVMRRIESSGK
ncbi:MAG: hypothetical protein EXQ52_18330 [Bryobacterales bacterium]|nr:hypothetical protein [Bryobacterales bacterium]